MSFLILDEVQLQFQPPIYIVTEGSGTLEFCVASSVAFAEGRSMTVHVQTSDSTANGKEKAA